MNKVGNLKYIVVEYFPEEMDGEEFAAARIDGHYRNREDAEGVAQWWAEQNKFAESRVVVAEIVAVTKTPKSWEQE